MGRPLWIHCIVWLVQLLCPNRHCIIAAAYDPESSNESESIEKLEELRKNLKLNPWCGLCGSTSLRYEAGPTVFGTMGEALPELAKCQIQQILTAELYSGAPKPN